MKRTDTARIARKFDALNQRPASEKVRLVTWTGHLTPDGDALASWLESTDTLVANLREASKGSLLHPAARYFRDCPAEAAELWTRYEASKTREAI